MRDERFTDAALALALLGCLLAFAGPLVLGARPGPRGSILFSALLGAVFAGKNAADARRIGRPRFPAGVVATALGGWLILAPLQYADVAAPLTAVTQSGGALLAAFSAYAALVALEPFGGVDRRPE